MLSSFSYGDLRAIAGAKKSVLREERHRAGFAGFIATEERGTKCKALAENTQERSRPRAIARVRRRSGERFERETSIVTRDHHDSRFYKLFEVRIPELDEFHVRAGVERNLVVVGQSAGHVDLHAP